MKIRAGFVSNSSSSSFCILGTQLSTEEDEKINMYYGNFPKNFVIADGIDEYSDSSFFGIYAESLDENKTILESKHYISEMASKLLERPIEVAEIQFFTDGGYDG